jgi:type III restriction enzyme
MLQLKNYQQESLDAIRDYLRDSRKDGADVAFYKRTKRQYHEPPSLAGIPYVCIRIPTGGGKTIVACHAVNVIADELHKDPPLIYWLVPSDKICEQTLAALKNRNHPYRQSLDSQFSSVTVMDMKEALYFTRATLDSSTTIIVSTLAAARVGDVDIRKVYESNGALQHHFDRQELLNFEPLDKREDGSFPYSFANVLRSRRPIVIVDEGHNAKTKLSFDMLARFQPECIIEFTATPHGGEHPSNVLHSVSAFVLKEENMIKMPIELTVLSDWKTVISAAIQKRTELEKTATEEAKKTGQYIRPILLIQAQSTSQLGDSLDETAIQQHLIENEGIVKDACPICTGDKDELGDQDLFAPNCPVRFIITKQKLREGWDCSFAYVLCSVAEVHSATAVEQILGRIMRLPYAKKRENASLNRAYTFARSAVWDTVAAAIKDGLVQGHGYEKFQAEKMVVQAEQPQLPWGTGTIFKPDEGGNCVSHDAGNGSYEGGYGPYDESEYANSEPGTGSQTGTGSGSGSGTKPSPRPRPAPRPLLSLPLFSVKIGDLFEPVEDTHLFDSQWSLADYYEDAKLDEAAYTVASISAQRGLLDVVETERVTTERTGNGQLVAADSDVEVAEKQVIAWLDRWTRDQLFPQMEYQIFLIKVLEHLTQACEIPLAELWRDKYTLRDSIRNRVAEIKRKIKKGAFQTLMFGQDEPKVAVTPERSFSFAPFNYPGSEPWKGHRVFHKHYYGHHFADLKPQGEEFDCACFLDDLEEVAWWVRNPVRYGFWFPTSGDRHFPDFVCLLKDGRFLVVEYKNTVDWDLPRNIEIRKIGDRWESLSEGKMMYVMPRGHERKLGEISDKIKSAGAPATTG